MKPFDPRLLRYARSARTVLGIGGILGVVRAVAMLAWSWCLALALAAAVLPVLGGPGGVPSLVAEGAPSRASLPALLAGAAVAAVVRAACTWGMDAVAARGAVRVKSELRRAALDAIDARAPGRGDASDSEQATTLGRGLDALDGYFSGYLPQLILTAVTTPVLVLAVLAADFVSGIIVIVVFPLVPVFMVLIGRATQSVQRRQWEQLQRLSASFLDVVSGLATLRIFGRERRQTARIARETDEYRSRTMQVLRVTFLSGFVLDLAGTLSIALVAVTIGTKLVDGSFPLALGLFVLLVMPEVFIPIRAVGAAFHASSEGLAAAEDVFGIIEGDAAETGAVARGGSRRETRAGERAGGANPSPGSGEALDSLAPIRFSEAVLERGGSAVVGPVSFGVKRGEVVALVGPSGAGKSTLIAALLGFVQASAGEAQRTGEVSWAGQRPGLLQGTIAENIALGADTVDMVLVRRALDAVLLHMLDPAQELGAGGTGVSGGQAQRIAVARALYRAWTRDAPILLLDEPTSALDAGAEAAICDALRLEAAAGRAVLVATHREQVMDAADRVVRVEAATAGVAA